MRPPKGYRVTAAPVRLVDGQKWFEGKVWQQGHCIGTTPSPYELRSRALEAGIKLAWKYSGQEPPVQESLAEEVVGVLLEELGSPLQKKSFTLEYRPYKSGDDWKWFWVLHPKDGRRAVGHGEADSRAAASTAARLLARQMKGIITQVRNAAYVDRL